MIIQRDSYDVERVILSKQFEMYGKLHAVNSI